MSKKQNNKSKRIWIYVGISITALAAVSVCCWYFFGVYKNQQTNTTQPKISEKAYTINNQNGFISNDYEFVNLGIISNPTTDSDYSYIRKRVSDHNLIGFTLQLNNSLSYKIGHWNTMNFSLLNDKYLNNKTSSQYLHADNIAKIINYFGFDVIGLTEINKDTVTSDDNSAATNFLNLVNSYIPQSKLQDYQYDMIVSKDTSSTTATDGQIEQVAILYNKKRLTNNVLNSNNGALIGSGYFYKNASINWGLSSDSKDQWQNYDYVRPPFGTSFSVKANDVSYNFTTLFSHFDSPGTSGNEASGTNGMGKQEMFEANNIQTPLQEFKNVYNSQNIIFMGDTNIPTGKQNIAFDTSKLSSLNYKFSFEDTASYNTSLATVATVEKNLDNPSLWYSNDYDKIIYSLSNFVISQNKMTDIWNFTIPNNLVYLNDKKYFDLSF